MVIISRYAWSISAKMLLLEHLGMPYRRGHESTSNDKNSLPEGEGAAPLSKPPLKGGCRPTLNPPLIWFLAPFAPKKSHF
jgi:hypothetical protein